MTRSEGFGFARREAEETDLERELGIVISKRNSAESLQSYGDGKFLFFSINGNAYVGVYRGTTSDGAHILKPSTAPNGANNLDSTLTYAERNMWVDEPSFHYGGIEEFKPVNRAYLEACASGFEKVAHLGTWLSKDEESSNKQSNSESD